MTLVNALNDRSAQVRQVAAWALGSIGDTIAIRDLARAFLNDADKEVRTTALWAMLSMDRVPADVMDAAIKSPDVEIRRRGVAMLAGHREAWPWPWPWPWPRPSP